MLLLMSQVGFAQKAPEDFGYRQVTYTYNNEEVFVIVRSKINEEHVKKPLLFFCQGSLPQPVIKYDDSGCYGVFPFSETTFLDDYHLVIVGKPGVPVIADVKNLTGNYCWLDGDKMPNDYAKNNHLDYYVDRNNYVIKKLLKETWATDKGFIVAGHSEGSYVAAKMAYTNSKIEKLIYSGGNPYGRIVSILSENRYKGTDETTLDYWKSVVENKDDDSTTPGDNDKTTYSFSKPANDDLNKLKIPVLVSYGTKDWSAPYNDLFQVDIIRSKKKNFKFLTYRGLEHNYFPVDDKMNPDFDTYNWDKVGADWLIWLKS